ncbi:DUF1800 domain-containing protein [Acuticoccus sediminis]|uniref:DUF1800 domain-containing protein n=1 Tax=Acuticoccus sediminis TaxID=2184697 RepID=A0A8B2NN31_9HYPH|nr:DUF1800 domain-containing protein [Acuticoccus sediminis]RAI00021.1 DUF1800 domain-containing protein [Acuticoccus sediminis]
MRSPALTAATRFGLGPEQDPGPTRESLAAELDNPRGARIASLDDLDTIRERYLAKDREFRELARAFRKNRTDETEAARQEAVKARQQVMREVEAAELEARYKHGVTTATPFLERLVLFWSNHFAVEARNVTVRLLAGNYEREAIRANVTGSFREMLHAAITHPAMLIYLDNWRSIGPNSKLGRRRGKGRLNENLARELLELHTLGVDGGYTQADVNELALALTGWTGAMQPRPKNPEFDARWHEPGARTILGRKYGQPGQRQLLAVLDDLAAHPSTAKFISRKFAHHFVGDQASDDLVEALRVSFVETDGDLAELAFTLISHPDAWSAEPTKVVPPYDFLVSTGRALEVAELPPRFLTQVCDALGQPIWKPPSPAGWPYKDNDFLGGDSVLERVDFAGTMVKRFAKKADGRTLARELFGDDLDPFVAETVDRAEDRHQALVLLLMSPAFQRR